MTVCRPRDGYGFVMAVMVDQDAADFGQFALRGFERPVKTEGAGVE